MIWSSPESRRANPSQQLLSRPGMHCEARKKYTTSLLNNQRSSNRQNSSKQHNKLGITGPCTTSTFFQRKKNIFYWQEYCFAHSGIAWRSIINSLDMEKVKVYKNHRQLLEAWLGRRLSCSSYVYCEDSFSLAGLSKLTMTTQSVLNLIETIIHDFGSHFKFKRDK